MSQSKSSIEERYAAVMELKEGASLSTVGKKYSMGSRTLKALLNRYEKQGISGLQTIQYVHYSDAFILSVMSEYETKQLSLNELSAKYDVSVTTIQRWIPKYALYKSGDKFAFNGGKLYKHEIGSQSNPVPHLKQSYMPETKEKSSRREALSKLSKKELYELLLDREAELELIKKAEALVRKRESRLHAIGRKSFKD